VLDDAVVVAGDRPGSDVDVLADGGVADVGQMRHLDPRPILAFFSSTKLPTFAFGPTCDSGRRWQNGPSVAASSITDSLKTQYGKSVTRSPTRHELKWLPTPMTQSLPIADCPSMTTWGWIVVSGPTVTVSSM
jgi:hypothetical protein